MQYGSGAEAVAKGRQARTADRIAKWTEWAERHPEDADAMAESTGWALRDIPHRCACRPSRPR